MHTVYPTGATWLQRGAIVSLIVHALIGTIGWKCVVHDDDDHEVIDIEVAPAPPPAEALPPEVIRAMEEAAKAAAVAQATQDDKTDDKTDDKSSTGGAGVDAGVDAAPDAAPDAARPDAARPDAMLVATIDAGVDAPEIAATGDAGTGDAEAIATIGDGGIDAVAVASTDPTDGGAGDAMTNDVTVIATAGSGDGSGGSGEGSNGSNGAGSGGGSDLIATGSNAGSGSGSAGTSNDPAVDGAPTTAGTAANLLQYFPVGHTVTALIRFDRLRGTEWAATTERLLKPMPDYQVLFGASDAKIVEKMDTLVISSPAPKDASATTLVAHVSMGRAQLRSWLDAGNPVTWSAAKGGLYGKRTGKTFKNDKRVFLSPFKGWFLLGQPGDLPGLTEVTKGDLDQIEATAKLPTWLAGIRKIEDESGGEKKGPALVLTLGFDGKKIDLQGNDFGLGVSAVQMPTRVSLAMEIVKQGWLVRGNIKFNTEKEAALFMASLNTVKERITESRALSMVVGKPIVHMLENLSVAQNGTRLSYGTSLSIADARMLLAVAAIQLDAYFGPPQKPTP